MFNFEKLEVYKEGLEFVKITYNIVKSFPKDGVFCLTEQLRRAAVSIASNNSRRFW